MNARFRTAGWASAAAVFLAFVAFSSGANATGQGSCEKEFIGAEPHGHRVQKLGPHLYRLGTLTIDSEARTIRCPGHVNMAEGGPIEVLACLPTGKVHESVLTLDVEPLDFQLALLLLGLEPGCNPAVRYPDGAPELEMEPGNMVDLCIEWDEAGTNGEQRRVRRRAEETLYNLTEDEPLGQTPWVFTGSRWVEGRFGAAVNGSLITTFYDPLAIIELPLEIVNDDTWCAVKEDALPPVGTGIELVVQQRAEEQDQPEEEPGARE